MKKFTAVVVLVAATSASAEVRLTGAGATFPQPLYERWVVEYQKSHPDVKVDYQGIGSGGGIKAITDKTGAFAGSDAPMNKKEIEAAGGEAALVEVPTCAGGVVPAYNVPGVKDLNMTGDVLADIFLGKITKWSDARIAALNPKEKLPDLAITPAWRTDGSGTTFVFTSYLAGQSEAFKSTIGSGKQVSWPAGQGGKGNPGVAAVVQQTAGALGYVEESYATANKLAFAAVKNKAGKLVRASTASIAAAGAGAPMDGALLVANIWDQTGDDAYPIASFTYVIVYRDLRNLKARADAQALAAFLSWAVHDGQKLAVELGYAPLAPAVQKKVDGALAGLTFEGAPVAR